MAQNHHSELKAHSYSGEAVPLSAESAAFATIRKRLAYLELGDDDIRQLKRIGMLLAKQEPEIIDGLYEYLLCLDEARPYLADNNTLLKLKQKQKEYFDALLHDNYDDEYIKSRQRVGEVHYRMGLTPEIYLSAYAKYIDLVLASIVEHCQDPQEHQAYTQALMKIMMFDISIAMDSYIQANEDSLNQHLLDLELLNIAAVELSIATGIKERTRTALQQVHKIFEPKAAAIALLETGASRFSAWELLDVGDAFIKTSEAYLSLIGMQCLSGTVPLVRDDVPATVRDNGFNYVTAVPLHRETSNFGVLYLFEQRHSTFNLLKLNQLKKLANLIAGALASARTHEETLFQATHDPLTGLANRRLLDKHLEESFVRSQQASQPMTMVMIDLDFFKSVNDVYGHAVGDLVLKQIALIVKKSIRKQDLAVRFGGEEICVVMENIDGSTAKKKADSIRSEIEATPVLLADGTAIYVTASAGVVCYPRCANSPQSMLEKGDQALYLAKEQGRNQVILYREMLKSEIEKNPQRISELLSEGYENIQAIVTAIDLKNRISRGHSNQVAKLASAFARYLGMDEQQSTTLQRAALLQDVGMVYIPDSLLDKVGDLSDKEKAVYRTHAEKGAELLAGLDKYKAIVEVVRHHHESYDGSGYPDGLRGDAIPVHARILRILNAYTAMTSERPQHQRLSHQEAVVKIEKSAGSRYDPGLLAQFVAFAHSGQYNFG